METSNKRQYFTRIADVLEVCVHPVNRDMSVNKLVKA